MKNALIITALTLSLGLILILTTAARAAGPGDLDSTFGNGGKVLTDLGGNDSWINAMVLQPDGKIVVAGSIYNGNGDEDAALARYNSNGSPDSTFGDGGVVVVPSSGDTDDTAWAIALQSDGKIVVTGAQDFHFVTARYNSNGALDSTFGSGGIVNTNLGGEYEAAQAVAIQPDGKIVIAGYSGPELTLDFAIIRYNSNGSLDSSFGDNGKIITDMGGYDSVEAVVVQPDNKIIVAGSDFQFILARYDSNGSLDASFGTNGIVTTPITPNSSSTLLDIALQSDGKIVATGYSYNDNYFAEFTLARYNSDGSMDNSFGTNGIVTTAIGEQNSYAQGIKLQSNGKIIVAGFTYKSYQNYFALARYNSNGSLDSTFDTDGIVTTAVGVGEAKAYALTLQGDGKIVAAGVGNSTFAVARYQVNGSPDLTFDTDGQAFTDLGHGEDWASSMTLQADGKIIVVGARWRGGVSDMAVVRYLSNGSLDPTFGNGGIIITPIGNFNDDAYDVAVQGDGKIVVVGRTDTDDLSYGSKFVVVRYNSNGTLDPTFDTDGIVITSFANGYSTANAVAIQVDGKIVVAGSGSNGFDSDFTLVRYNSDGSLDTSFNGDGKVLTPIDNNSYDAVNDLALQPDGKIVVVGFSYSSSEFFVLARYHSNGSLDTSFGMGGIIAGSIEGRAEAVAFQANKIVVAGFSYIGGDYNEHYFSVASYGNNGTLDTTFDGDGIANLSLDNGASTAFGAAFQADGKIVAAGNSNSHDEFTVVRFNPNGSLDTSFDSDGIAVNPFGGQYGEALAVALQPDGKIVAAGKVRNDIALVRYQGDFSASFPVLTLTKTVNNTTPLPGQPITYTVSVQNNGTENATNVVISDPLPNGLTLAGPITLNPAGAGLTGALPTLVSGLTITAGQRITVTFPVTVSNSLGGMIITNTATVTSTEVITPVTGTATILIPSSETPMGTYLPIVIKAQK